MTLSYTVWGRSFPRYIWLFAFLSLIPLHTSAQQSVDQWIIGSPLHGEQAFGLVELPSGDVLVIVNEEIDSLGGIDLGLWRVTPAGALSDRKVFGSEWNDYARGLSLAMDGEMLLTGMRLTSEPQRQIATLIKLDTLGQISWTWTHPDTNRVSEFKVARCSSTGIILACGSISDTGGPGLDPLIVAFDLNGEVQWISSQRDDATDIAHAPWPLEDGSWVVVGDQQLPDLSYRPFAMRISAQDSLLWRQVYDQQLNSGAQDLTRLQDGNFVLVGESYSGPGSFYFDILVQKFRPDGQGIWQRLHGGTLSDAGFGIFEDTMDHRLTVAGYGYHDAAENTDAIMLWLDSTGLELARSYAGGPSLDHGNALIPSRKGGFWIAGFSNQGIDTQVFLAKGNWSSGATSLPSFSPSNSRIFPNPVIAGQMIHLETSASYGANWQLYGIQGEFLNQYRFSQGETFSWKAPSVPGIYTFMLSTSQGREIHRLLVIK